MTLDQAIHALDIARQKMGGDTELHISYDGGHQQEAEMVAIRQLDGKDKVWIGEFFSDLLPVDAVYIHADKDAEDVE